MGLTLILTVMAVSERVVWGQLGSILSLIPYAGDAGKYIQVAPNTEFAEGSFAGEKKTVTVNGVDYTFCWCPPGEFEMGSPETEEERNNDETQHHVTLTRGFWLLESEVTQEMWQSVMGTVLQQLYGDTPDTEDWFGIGPHFPMHSVSWYDASEFCLKLSKLMDEEIVLPTEAQWEYACRAGSAGFYAGTGNLDEMGWHEGNCNGAAHPFEVKGKEPNAWGLYDMHGNVWEWCSDWWGDYPETSVVDPLRQRLRRFMSLTCGAGEVWIGETDRIIRGGGWQDSASACRAASRGRSDPKYGSDHNGFRPALIPAVSETVTVGTVASDESEKSVEKEVPSDLETPVPESVSAEELEAGTEPGEKKTLTVNGIDYTFRWCPPGEFTMGSPESEEERHDDETQHQVRLTHGFWMLESEVTQEMWLSVMEDAESRLHSCSGEGPDFPIYNTDWNEANEFCRGLSRLLGCQVNLPTEAQWEYACRAGSEGTYSGTGNLEEMGWSQDYGSGETTHKVKGKEPNAWGLYDMHGNVYEWCSDWYDHDYYTNSSDTDPTGPSNGSKRIIRGGSMTSYKDYCRSATRYRVAPSSRTDFLGFRVVLTSEESQSEGKDAENNSAQFNETQNADDRTDKIKSVRVQSPVGKGSEPGEKITITVKGLDYTFCWCPPGEFMMGSSEWKQGPWNKNDPHIVKLKRGFWMLESEVTQEMWLSIMEGSQRCGLTESIGINPYYPVYNVFWETCLDFCDRISELSGEIITLPTEAQWEYACRAGSDGDFGGTGIIDQMGWYSKNSGHELHDVKTKSPNTWGLYDMNGNIWEWALDWEGDYDVLNVTSPLRGLVGSRWFYRGGSAFWPADYCKTTSRCCFVYGYWSQIGGFRPILIPGVQDEEATEDPSESPSVSSNEQPDDTGIPRAETTEKKTLTVNGIDYTFCWCPPGEFMMGSPDSEEEHQIDEKQHRVTLSQGFWMLESEVTQEMWTSVMGESKERLLAESGNQNPRYPIFFVNWNECQDFCRRLGDLLGEPIRLPTEAQWEYACRAGSEGKFAGTGNLDDMGWYNRNSDIKVHEVMALKPNAWGLYDMHGNVWEWCSDSYDRDYYDKSPDTDPSGPDGSWSRIMRGGSWYTNAKDCRSAVRMYEHGSEKGFNLGFRVVFAQRDNPRQTTQTNNQKNNSSVVSEKTKSDHVERLGIGTKPGEKKTLTVNDTDYTFCWCPPGEFTMGCPDSELGMFVNPGTQHHVKLTRGFWMLESEVTQEMWENVMGTTIQQQRDKAYQNAPLSGTGDHCPMYYVNWEESGDFCRRLSELSGEDLRLPTEAEWEYACRAGTTGPYAGTGVLDEMGWYSNNSNSTAHEIKEKEPNAWGMYDMHGNVGEWCSDRYGKKDDSDEINPEGSSDGPDRVIRGGGWNAITVFCHSAFRLYDAPADRNGFTGFRPVLIPAADDTSTANGGSSENELRPEPVPEKIAAGTEPGEKRTLTVNGTDFTFRWCPPGEFVMGSPESEENRLGNETPHPVSLTCGFWILESEVTQEMWEGITEDPDMSERTREKWGRGPRYPMYIVNWDECREFCRQFSELSGQQAELPSEAQWEYACRAGSESAYAGTGDLDGMGWYGGNSDDTPHEVKGKEPNSWGLYDMHGSVWEWCGDWYGAYDNSKVTDPAGPGDGLHRVIRGGDWKHSARFCRSAFRFENDQLRRYHWLGFRFILVPKTTTTESDDESSAKNDRESSPGENNVSADEVISENTVFDGEGDVIIEGTVLTRFSKDVSKYSIPDSVTEIGEYAFADCSSLTEINIPESVTEIGDSAFRGCYSLTEINIPDSVAEIGQQAFEGCSSLAKINIPNSVTEIGMGVFSHCSSLTEINVSSDNSLFHCEDGILFEGTVLHTFLAGKDVQSYNIPDFVTEIGGCAFYGCSSLAKINIPDSVTEIGWGAFEYCSSLSEINIPKSVTKIGGWPFHCCSSLPEIKVSAENPVFHDQDGVLFEGTVLRTFPLQKNVSAYSIPESTTKISAGAFIGCTSLTEVNIPESVTEIDRAAFEDCTSLTKIDIPESVTEIGDSAFRDCSSLTDINIPKSVTEIENWTFGGCSSLTAIQIPESVTEIHGYAFCGCHSLTEINIPDGITKIGDGTFESCSSLTKIDIPESITKIGLHAFFNCSSLTEIRIPNSVTEIGMSALSFCTSLEKVYAPKDIDLSKAGIRDSADVIRY